MVMGQPSGTIALPPALGDDDAVRRFQTLGAGKHIPCFWSGMPMSNAAGFEVRREHPLHVPRGVSTIVPAPRAVDLALAPWDAATITRSNQMSIPIIRSERDAPTDVRLDNASFTIRHEQVALPGSGPAVASRSFVGLETGHGGRSGVSPRLLRRHARKIRRIVGAARATPASHARVRAQGPARLLLRV